MQKPKLWDRAEQVGWTKGNFSGKFLHPNISPLIFTAALRCIDVFQTGLYNGIPQDQSSLQVASDLLQLYPNCDVLVRLRCFYKGQAQHRHQIAHPVIDRTILKNAFRHPDSSGLQRRLSWHTYFHSANDLAVLDRWCTEAYSIQLADAQIV